MASERAFGQALLESDFVNPNFFYLLSKEDKKALRSCQVNIPPTALFEQGFAKALFTTEILKSNNPEVKKKVGRDVDSDDVFEVMTKGVQDPQAVCAVLIFAAPRSNELTHVRFMDKEEVRHFIYHELEKPKALMQRFVIPKGNTNNMILATWSPLLVLTEGRRSVYSLNDRHVTANKRGLTFEDPSSTTVDVAISENVIDVITKTCRVVADHFEKVERLVLNRMTAFFKVDANNNIVLLYSTSLRFHDIVTSQPAVSLEAGVHLTEKKNQSLTSRFVRLGGKVPRGVDALDYMDEALRAVDAKKKKDMMISIPAVGNTGMMLLNSIQGRTPSTMARSPSPTKQSRKGVQTPASLRSAGGGGSGGGSGSNNGDNSPALMSPVSSKHCPSANPFPTASPASSVLAPPSHGNNSSSAPMPTMEGQFLTVAPNAPLPQPRALLKYQHVLPNSVNNMNAQIQLHALGSNEEAIRAEWESFLVQQTRDIKKVRVSQAAANLGKNANSDGSNSDPDGNGGGSHDDYVNQKVFSKIPPPKHHSIFGGADGKVAKSVVIGEEKDIAKLNAEAAATLKAAQDKAAQREKDTFMNEMRNEVAHRALKGSGITSGGDNKGDKNGGDDVRENLEGEAVELDDDPRFYYIPRDSRTLVSMPEGSGFTRSTLLPPVFHSAGGPVANLRAVQKSLKPVTGPVVRKKQEAPKGSSAQGAAVLSPSKQSPTTAKPSVAIPSPINTAHQKLTNTTAAKPQPHSDQSHHSSPQSPPLSPEHKQQNNSITSMSSTVKESFASMSASGTTQIDARRNFAPVNDSPTKKDYLQQAIKERAIVSKKFDDFSALDEQELPQIFERVAFLCRSFATFVQDLLYSIHGAFLVKSISIAYVELPLMFQPFVSVRTLSLILHKLHGRVERRTSFLLEGNNPTAAAAGIVSSTSSHNSPPAMAARKADAVKWRKELVDALCNVNLMDYTYQTVESWDQLLPNTARGEEVLDQGRDYCLVIPLLDSAVGLSILREESFGVEHDVEAFIRDDDGVIFNSAVQHCYFTRIAEIKGEQAAEMERRQQETALEEERQAALELTRKSIYGGGGDDEDAAADSVRAASPPGSPTMKKKKKSVYRGMNGATVVAPDEQDPYDEVSPEEIAQAELDRKVNDMMCPRCNTCRICCVCSLVFSPKKK